ncbi:hypothetical protein [Hydrogenobacter hydrogenophilus]|uniref:Uncharacterized protein n=1 Tax=Hydrogenobacter hydrogenophilus TaxID=35835 RepID=A0A285P1G2_9AQUI|nr:hypothetical protein [Hydrogenobacter hydrogenophilus]SNZ15572.1 hypothetical protein SAMN06265353_1404 [Hydrogenobacter hydrogenophilus]
MKVLLRHLIDLQEPALERFSVLTPRMKGKLLEFLLQDFLGSISEEEWKELYKCVIARDYKGFTEKVEEIWEKRAVKREYQDKKRINQEERSNQSSGGLRSLESIKEFLE